MFLIFSINNDDGIVSMAAPLDLDQMHTFVAIADTGSFTRAADEVHRTQSAVSMQMRRLEERIGKPLFEKEGRSNKLSEEGERLLSYARRLIHLNRETLAAFDDRRLEGTIRIGTPDDYADRFLPEIMARFARSNPRVELTVICEPTPGLVEHIKRGNLDLALVTHDDARGQSEVVRREPLLWVSSANHATHEQETLPMAFGRPNCIWRRAACDVLDRMNRDYRVLFTSFSATVITAAVLSGLAISVLPECALQARHARARRRRWLRRPARLQDRHHARPYQPAGTGRGAGPPHRREPRQHLGSGRRGERHVSTSRRWRRCAANGSGRARSCRVGDGVCYLRLSKIVNFRC